MATRSRIGMVQSDGSVKSIYCHWDGYPQNNGNILIEHYTDIKKVKSLIELGSISSLGKNVNPDPIGGITAKYSLRDGFENVPANGVHTFDNPQVDVTVAYSRDRGGDIEIQIDESESEFIKSDLEEWGYLFKDGKWFVIDAVSSVDERTLEVLDEEYFKKHN
jgi:hypothetical protein